MASTRVIALSPRRSGRHLPGLSDPRVLPICSGTEQLSSIMQQLCIRASEVYTPSSPSWRGSALVEKRRTFLKRKAPWASASCDLPVRRRARTEGWQVSAGAEVKGWDMRRKTRKRPRQERACSVSQSASAAKVARRQYLSRLAAPRTCGVRRKRAEISVTRYLTLPALRDVFTEHILRFVSFTDAAALACTCKTLRKWTQNHWQIRAREKSRARARQEQHTAHLREPSSTANRGLTQNQYEYTLSDIDSRRTALEARAGLILFLPAALSSVMDIA